VFSVTLEGDEALDARLAAMPAAVQTALRAKAAQLAEALRAHVVQDELSGQVLHARTGALRDSIAAEVTVDGAKILVRLFSRGDVRYAAIQEYGGRTPAHDIVPNKAKALAFLAGGRRVFARIVHHPGSTIPARPYLGPALAQMGPQIESELKAALVAGLGA
jgi:phage gpG-like protein